MEAEEVREAEDENASGKELVFIPSSHCGGSVEAEESGGKNRGKKA